MSPVTVRWPSMYTPSVVVRPTMCDHSSSECAPACATVVVFPFVPVIAAIGIRVGVPGGKEHVDDRTGHVARRSFGRRDVHAEARRRVHFADAATDLAVALA